MHGAVDPLVVVVLLLNFYLLGTSRLRAAINGSAMQGTVLGLLAVFVHPHFTVRIAVLAIAAIAIKGLFIPQMLHRAMRDLAIRREVEPYIGFTASLLLGAIATGGSLVFTRTLPLHPDHARTLLVPAAFATVMTGFLILTTRRKAITQVVGYLVLENGVFVMGLTLLEAMPYLVEIGVLLDLVVGIFVMGIIINHIRDAFSSVDTARLSALKE